MSCTDVQTKLHDQALAWKTADNCQNGGEKCLYSVSLLMINIFHTCHLLSHISSSL